ncbi:hypothetical protein [Brevibacillus porteri]|uniref:hypothetical protein n=1 Tax=Brevibacillus porteri TaxID=2126350 RepID=UPI003D1C3363
MENMTKAWTMQLKGEESGFFTASEQVRESRGMQQKDVSNFIRRNGYRNITGKQHLVEPKNNEPNSNGTVCERSPKC